MHDFSFYESSDELFRHEEESDQDVIALAKPIVEVFLDDEEALLDAYEEEKVLDLVGMVSSDIDDDDQETTWSQIYALMAKAEEALT